MMVPARRAAPRFTSYRPRRGLGLMSYYDLMAQADIRSCDPFDSPCVERNRVRQAAVEDFWVGQHMTVPDGTVLDFSSGQLTAQGGTPAAAYSASPVSPYVAPPAQAVAMRPGTLAFATSRGGSLLYPGDTWTVSIRGASPNLTVSVEGGKDGASAQTVMGATDPDGNFNLSGTISADQVGNWQETWYVSSQRAGSFSFTVQPAPQQTTPDGKLITKSSDASQAPGGQAAQQTPSALSIGDWLQGSAVAGIPNWALAGGVVAALFMFGGGRGR